MRIVQLSDLHLRPSPLYSGIDPWRALQDALARIRGLDVQPDILLLSGDLADDGALATYARLKVLLEGSGYRYAVLPGNHDSRDGLRAAFPGQAWISGQLACQRIDCGEWSLMLLDTLVPGEEGGDISLDAVHWLETSAPVDRRIVLVMHHPPFKVGIPGMDAIACAHGERLLAWMARCPRVEALWCGHVHRFVTTTFGGRPALTAPSTVHQIALNRGRLAWTDEPPGLLVHDCEAGGAWRSHYLPVTPGRVVAYDD
jgi:3',5'-cyclic AMP phosphodiesterase CpdA